MEREQTADSTAVRIDDELMKKLSTMVRAARSRAGVLRDRATGPASNDFMWISEALQELDTAHEELRVAEEELHTQADELLDTHGALEVERRRYREMFEDAPEPYLITDAHGLVLEANRRACRLLGMNAAFLAGKPLAVFVAAADRGVLREMMNRLSKQSVVSTFALCISPRRASAPIRTIVSLSRAVGHDGQASALRWIIHEQPVIAPERRGDSEPSADFHGGSDESSPDGGVRDEDFEREQSARIQSELALHRQEERLEIITHELRNPLSSVKGWLELLAANNLTPELREHAQTVIARNVETLNVMLEQLADNTRLGEELLTIDPRDLDLTALIRNVVENHHASAQLAGIRLGCKLDPKVSSVRADPFRFHQILLNLLSNALKFTPSGGSVEVSTSLRGEFVEIAVRDTGHGIAPDQLRAIFEAFVRLSGHSPRATGLGLGLNIARRLTELHGGTLSAESAGEGKGSTFRVRLPRAEAAQSWLARRQHGNSTRKP